MISFFSQDIEFDLKNKHRKRLWFKELMARHGKKRSTINIIFCSNSYILEVNRQFLWHNYCTDVISFDYNEPQLASMIKGDIFIGIETVRSNAIKFGASSFEEEMLRVMAHGLFHLLGYNDDTMEERLLMTQMENEAIKLYMSL